VLSTIRLEISSDSYNYPKSNDKRSTRFPAASRTATEWHVFPGDWELPSWHEGCADGLAEQRWP
jgi:hypothetical protein